jgi:hypothetical protein
VLIMVLASGLHAHIAASTATLLLSLGVNRLAQAAVVVVRATGLGVPFAPEKDGKVFMGETFRQGSGDVRGRGGDYDARGSRRDARRSRQGRR